MTDSACLIVTTAHHPDDGRLTRHSVTIRQHGMSCAVRAAAPRRLLRPFLAPIVVLRVIRSERPDAVIFPDPELFVVGPLIARMFGVRSIIDIHEDYSAVARTREWLPAALRPVASRVVRFIELAGRRLADATIVADTHLARPGDLVVPNIPSELIFPIPPNSGERKSLIYVGDITEDRGAFEMLELLRLVSDIDLELVGPVDASLKSRLIQRARKDSTSDRIRFLGRMPYHQAWTHAAGALAGLSFLKPTPAYKHAVPSKLWEYMAVGLPVIATDLPAQRAILEQSMGGRATKDVEEAAALAREWRDYPDTAVKIGLAGRSHFLAARSGSKADGLLMRAILGDQPMTTG